MEDAPIGTRPGGDTCTNPDPPDAVIVVLVATAVTPAGMPNRSDVATSIAVPGGIGPTCGVFVASRVSTKRLGVIGTKRPIDDAGLAGPVTTPATSTITCPPVWENTVMVPSAPTGTITWLEMFWPARSALRCDAPPGTTPVGTTCQNPGAVASATVTVATIALIVPGSPSPPPRSVPVAIGRRSVPPAPSANTSAGGVATRPGNGMPSHGMPLPLSSR